MSRPLDGLPIQQDSKSTSSFLLATLGPDLANNRGNWIVIAGKEDMAYNSVWFRVSAYCLLVLSWIFFVSVISDCTFLRIGLVNTSYGDLEEFGIFQLNLDSPEGHRCAQYPPSIAISAGFKAARAFGVIGCLALGVAMMQVLCLIFLTDYKRHLQWMIIRVEIIIALVCQLLTFSAFSEDNCSFPSTKCVPGAAGILAIINIIILCILCWMYWVMTSPEYPIFELRRRVPPPPLTAPPPTLEEQEKALNESVEVSMEESRQRVASPTGSYRGPAEDEDIDVMPPPTPPRKDNSFNDGIEDRNVPLDKIDEESF